MRRTQSAAAICRRAAGSYYFGRGRSTYVCPPDPTGSGSTSYGRARLWPYSSLATRSGWSDHRGSERFRKKRVSRLSSWRGEVAKPYRMRPVITQHRRHGRSRSTVHSFEQVFDPQAVVVAGTRFFTDSASACRSDSRALRDSVVPSDRKEHRAPKGSSGSRAPACHPPPCIRSREPSLACRTADRRRDDPIVHLPTERRT